MKPPPLALALALLAAGCGAPPKPERVSERRVLMGTEVTILAWDARRPAEEVRRAVDAAFARMEALEAVLSRHRPDSELSRLNAAAGGDAVAVGPELGAVLDAARRAFAGSGGAFDPTVGPLVALWIGAAKAGRWPADAEIAAARERVGFGAVSLDPAEGPVERVRLPSGFALDLGGIAKGFIVDAAVRVVRDQAGVANVLVEAGGDLFGAGTRFEGGPWRVGVQDPTAGDEARVVRTLKAEDRGVTTSGHYRRFSTIEGRRVSHILDPTTGRPVEQAVASVTVLAPDATAADGWSTAVAVLGVEKGLALIESLPGVEALVLTAGEDGAIRSHPSSGLKPFLLD